MLDLRFELELHYRCTKDNKDLKDSEAYALLVAEHGAAYAEKWVEEYEPDTGSHQLGNVSSRRDYIECNTVVAAAQIHNERNTEGITLRTG